jgi:uncharacterized membrane protein YphA (DoxX/SURF4 family)
MIYFGLQKVGDPAAFLKAIHGYDSLAGLPPLLLNTIASWVPILEITGGVCLALGILRRGSALMLSLMLVGFTAAVIAQALAIQANTGQDFCDLAFDCGCGSGIVPVCTKLLQNAFMLLACTWIAWSPEPAARS